MAFPWHSLQLADAGQGLASKLAAAQGAGGAPGGAAPGGYGAGMPAQQQYGQGQPAQQSYGAAPSGYGAGAPAQAPYGAQSASHPPSMQPGGYAQGPLAGQQGQQGGYSAPPGPPPPTGARPTSGQYGQSAPPPGGAAPPPYGAPPAQPSYGQPPQQSYAQPPSQQAGQYGQPPAQQAGGYGGAQQSPRPTGNGPSAQQIQQVLENCAREQKLQAFYPPGSPAIQQIAQRVASSGALEKVAQQWRLPMEIAIDLCKIALFDTVLFLDDSGSMQFEENGERIDDLKLIIGRVAFAASLFDTDGIQVRFMNSQVQGNGLRTEAEAVQLVAQVKFSGLTPFGSQLDQKVIFPLLLQPARSGQLQKPVLIIAVTDGQPAGEDRHMINNVLLRATDELSRTRYGADALSLSIAQVGNDLKARAFLEELDSDPRIGSMIDCTSNYELEADEMQRKGVELTPELWLVKMLLGSIDDSYDEKDETRC